MDRPQILDDGPVTTGFDTRIASRREPPAAWLPGLPLTIGYSWPPGAPAPIPIVALGGEDVSQSASLLLGDGDRLIVEIDLTAIADLACPARPEMYLRARAVVDPDGAAFRGGVAATCADRSGGGEYDWLGEAAPARADRFRAILAIASRRPRPTSR
jgi:hypothetical protein